MKRNKMILIITTVTTALMAGLMFAWSVAVIPGLKNIPDQEYITAVQSINRAIQNPLFLLCFMGTAVLLPVSAYISYGQPISTKFWLVLAAAALYIIGVFGVTMAGNVPLNEALDKFNLTAASAEEIGQQRIAFESRWVPLHHVRTVCNVLSLIFLLLSLTTTDAKKIME